MKRSFLALLLSLITSYVLFPCFALGQIRSGVDSPPPKEKKLAIESTTTGQFRYFPQSKGLRFLPSSGATAAAIVRAPIAKEKNINNLTQAESLAKKGSFLKAILLYKAILKDNNSLIEARLGLGYALLQTEAFSEAILEFDKVLEKDPNNTEAQLNRGVTLYCLGNIDQAIEQYKNIKTTKKDYLSTISFNLGLAYYLQDNFAQSESSYLNAIAQKTSYPEAYNNLGLLYQFHGKIGEASQCFSTAIAQRFNYSLAHYNLAGLLNNQLKFDEAIKEIQLALNQNPVFAEAYLNLGNIYLKKILLYDTSDLGKAITAYKEALRLKDGYYPFAHENLAIALSLDKKLDAAFSEYRKALNQYALIPAETVRNLLSSVTKQPSFVIASELNRLDDKTKPNIKAEVTTNSFDSVFDEYQNLGEELKNNADIRYCLGITYQNAGKLTEACEELFEALKISNNKDLEAKQALEYMFLW